MCSFMLGPRLNFQLSLSSLSEKILHFYLRLGLAGCRNSKVIKVDDIVAHYQELLQLQVVR